MDSSRKYIFARKREEVERLEAQGKAYETIIEKELEKMTLKPGMEVLDAGCGTGVVARKIAQRISPGTVYAVDNDPVFIKNARNLARKEDIENIKFELDDIYNLNYDNNTFDASYCRLVLMHLSDPVNAVKELKRVVKKERFLGVSDIDDAGTILYPRLSKATKLLTQYGKLSRNRGEDRHIGRKLFSIFSQAELSSINIYPSSIHATRQDPQRMKRLLSIPLQIIKSSKETILNQGYLNQEEFEQGIEKIQDIITYPGAFVMLTTFFALGKVPKATFS